MATAFPLRDLPLALTESERVSKHASLYGALRQAIMEGRLPPGARLPASRDLASQLGLARGTVVGVYDSLMAEGYLRSARGAGTFVAETLPDCWLTAASKPAAQEYRPRPALLSKRSEPLVRSPFLALPLTPPRAFRPHTPAIEPALHAKWTALEARRARQCTSHDLRDVDARGYRPLRETWPTTCVRPAVFAAMPTRSSSCPESMWRWTWRFAFSSTWATPRGWRILDTSALAAFSMRPG